MSRFFRYKVIFPTRGTSHIIVTAVPARALCSRCGRLVGLAITRRTHIRVARVKKRRVAAADNCMMHTVR